MAWARSSSMANAVTAMICIPRVRSSAYSACVAWKPFTGFYEGKAVLATDPDQA